MSIFKAKLAALSAFQRKYPTSHVGGSIGLFLHGIDLGRSLDLSDLDITVDEFDRSKLDDTGFDELSDASDFDARLRAYLEPNGFVKVDLRICPEPSFEVIEYEGATYNVSKLRDILYWKRKYADKDVEKHKSDLKACGIILPGVQNIKDLLF